MRRRETLTLGRAIAISGAAVDPNMSFYQSCRPDGVADDLQRPARLLDREPRLDGWKAESPRFGDLLFTEFFGRTDNTGNFVHLSDGGHFENLGVYELIRRRCRYVVAVDAGDDADPSDDNLANLIRLCRIDFGVRIKIDTEPLRADGPDRLTPDTRRDRQDPLRRRRPGRDARHARLRQDLDDRRRAPGPSEVRQEGPGVPPPADRPPAVVRRGAVRELPGPGRPHRPPRLR